MRQANEHVFNRCERAIRPIFRPPGMPEFPARRNQGDRVVCFSNKEKALAKRPK